MPSLFNEHYAFRIMEEIEQTRDTERNQYCSPVNNHKSFHKKIVFYKIVYFMKWWQLKPLAAQDFCLARNCVASGRKVGLSSML